MRGENAKLLTVTEASEFLSIRPRTIHKLVRDGKLGCVQVTPKERRFTSEQLAAYVEGQTIAPKEIDRKLGNPLPSKTKGGEKRRERVTRVSERVSVREEIRKLCQ